ncbi:MAG: XRE family aerobic/anaerobic benzoate catabolism transcriptional regulator [Planctomycetota bacterium]|jgi:XRE family aerobic/anaerobic benzoate catabolism transcriptional regulator
MPTPEKHPFLRALGQRMRSLREERGLALAELARAADVSRRYLTDLEAGRGNPSVLVLLRLLRPLRCTFAALSDVPVPTSAVRRVALLGLRGAGKSTVGRLLGRRLEVPFVELDRRVEEVAGFSLGEVFDLHGGAGFERHEQEALERLLCEGEALVFSTGGSIVDHYANFERLLSTCRTVWLRARPEEHLARVTAQGDRRPMADHPHALEELEDLLGRRELFYARAELTVDTHGRSPEDVASLVCAGLGLEQ